MNLKVNTNKNKVVVFDRSGECEQNEFTIKVVEQVTEYLYLGGVFERNGNGGNRTTSEC